MVHVVFERSPCNMPIHRRSFCANNRHLKEVRVILNVITTVLVEVLSAQELLKYQKDIARLHFFCYLIDRFPAADQILA